MHALSRKRGDARQFTSFEPLEERTASGRDIGKSSVTPAAFNAATVSPPPATDTSLPAFVNFAAARASANVPSPNGEISKAPERAVPKQRSDSSRTRGHARDRSRPDI